MGRTTVIHIQDRQPGDVYIGRAGRGEDDGYFGNPYTITGSWTRPMVIEAYRGYFENRIQTDAEFKRRVLRLRGKRLVCFCAPEPCHGDVIAEWCESQPG